MSKGKRIEIDAAARLVKPRDIPHAMWNLSESENARVSQDRFREGLIPVAELLDAQTRLLRSGLDHSTSATRVRQARANLDRAVGR